MDDKNNHQKNSNSNSNQNEDIIPMGGTLVSTSIRDKKKSMLVKIPSNQHIGFLDNDKGEYYDDLNDEDDSGLKELIKQSESTIYNNSIVTTKKKYYKQTAIYDDTIKNHDFITVLTSIVEKTALRDDTHWKILYNSIQKQLITVEETKRAMKDSSSSNVNKFSENLKNIKLSAKKLEEREQRLTCLKKADTSNDSDSNSIETYNNNLESNYYEALSIVSELRELNTKLCAQNEEITKESETLKESNLNFITDLGFITTTCEQFLNMITTMETVKKNQIAENISKLQRKKNTSMIVENLSNDIDNQSHWTDKCVIS